MGSIVTYVLHITMMLKVGWDPVILKQMFLETLIVIKVILNCVYIITSLGKITQSCQNKL